MMTKQQEEMLIMLKRVGPISAIGLRECFRSMGYWNVASAGAYSDRLRRLVKRGLVFSNYLYVKLSWEHSDRLAYALTRKGKRVLEDD